MARTLWQHRDLIYQVTRRELLGRYRGSMLGVTWSFVNPLLMLGVYTFVFAVIFKARWGIGPDDGTASFATLLFVGLMVFGMFAECTARAPTLIVANASYVRKVVFPLEILPASVLGSALLHLLISAFVLLTGMLLLGQTIHPAALLLPLVILPLVLGTLGVMWLLAGLGVYVRDISQVVGMVNTALMFLSPVFFPVSSVPEPYRDWFAVGPLTAVIENARLVLVRGDVPDLLPWLANCGVGLLLAWAGFWWFQRARRGFADVL